MGNKRRQKKSAPIQFKIQMSEKIMTICGCTGNRQDIFRLLAYEHTFHLFTESGWKGTY